MLPLLVLPFRSHEICEEGPGQGGNGERMEADRRERGGGGGGGVGEEARRIQRGGCGVIIIMSRYGANFFKKPQGFFFFVAGDLLKP